MKVVSSIGNLKKRIEECQQIFIIYLFIIGLRSSIRRVNNKTTSLLCSV